ncbi:MAG: lysine--tRNA ligase [Dehalococcoidia bacterium]|jgi:lysyl-tRNA synthetase class 2|nr:lysine--tRNA ligase [Dehalococcoidia bacterium]
MARKGGDLLLSRREKFQRLRSKGIEPFPSRYRRTHTIGEAVELFRSQEAEEGAQARTAQVSLAGRIVSLRGMGRATFLNMQDASGHIQVHLRRDILEQDYELARDLDLGDFLGASGPLFLTHTGEITVEASQITFLGKAMRPLPEKWHGLSDVETRHRQRYLDLITNEEARHNFQVRSRIIGTMRRFLDAQGFMEVETPVLVPVAAGAMAQPFATHHNSLDRDLYLRIATELYLKRLIVGGLDKVYEIGRVFRNEGIDQDHNPEFTLLESYEAYADYNDVMALVEQMVSAVAHEVLGTTKVQFGENVIDFAPPWRRLSLRKEVQSSTGIDFQDFQDVVALEEKMRSIGISVDGRSSRGRLIDKLVTATVEPQLIQPTFLLDYPLEMSPLAKQRSDDPSLVERFEGFAGGMEIANAFSELNDPEEQRQRFMDQEDMRKKMELDEDMDRLDEDYLLALEHGMPPTGGLGMGIDRLAMLLTGQESIREVILFPQLRER